MTELVRSVLLSLTCLDHRLYLVTRVGEMSFEWIFLIFLIIAVLGSQDFSRWILFRLLGELDILLCIFVEVFMRLLHFFPTLLSFIRTK